MNSKSILVTGGLATLALIYVTVMIIHKYNAQIKINIYIIIKMKII